MKDVKLIKVFIASPGDVGRQRDEVKDLIIDWNNEHTDSKNVVLMPVRWENNSVASYRDYSSGQAIINEQIVKSSDILIAIFWSKIGLRTENHISGTVEEINVFYDEHKRGVGIYFVNENVSDQNLDDRKDVLMYKEELEKKQLGLYSDYDLKKIRHFLTREVDELLKKGSNVAHLTKESSAIVSFNLFDKIEFDYGEQLFALFMVENELCEFKEGWQIDETIDEIRKWETRNNLTDYLSNKIQLVINQLRNREYIKTQEITGNGNPKLCIIDEHIYKKFKISVGKQPEKVNGLKLRFTK